MKHQNKLEGKDIPHSQCDRSFEGYRQIPPYDWEAPINALDKHESLMVYNGEGINVCTLEIA